MSIRAHAPNLMLPDSAKGIMLALVANAMFVTVGVCVRQISDNIDVFQILLFRQLVFITVLSPSIYKNLDTLLRPRMLKLHALRIGGAFFALLLGFVTVSNLPLAEATALGFSKVLFVALFARFLLNEAIGKSRLTTIVTGFAGVMLVVQPSLENMTFLYTLTGLGSAVAAAVAVFCVKKIIHVESKTNLLVYQAFFVGLLTLLPSIIYWKWPTAFELAILIFIGLISSAAQWISVTAYSYGEANVISNVEYTKMIYSIFLGYFFFAELPDALSVAGVMIILASAFIPQLLKKRTMRRQTALQLK
ncbi:DMT family transporter [Desulfovibrio sp. JC022]|uniref:DMT family transporter n=1 Tax=Desulfovibrio sp. JC022 TaxID=2593642 RepID=UPI0013D36BC4|nr:DMT family transporter [Desulfovibrio sp. JC022]NDV24549.1 DMT family transporter [Desulfovibrio sp. JC022]